MLGLRPLAVLWVAAGLLGDAQAGTVLTKWINSYAGPWTTYVDRFGMCDPHEMSQAAHVDLSLRVSHWSPHRPAALQTLTGHIKLVNLTFSDDDWVRITLAKRSNNEWKRNAFVFSPPGGGCTFFRSNLPGVFQAFFGMDPKATGPCLVPMGTYLLRNRSVDWDAPNVPSLPYGHYRFDIVGGNHRFDIVGRYGRYGLAQQRAQPGGHRLCVWAEQHFVPRAAKEGTHQ